VYRLTNVTQHYAWGSDHAISDLLGTAPSGLPEAELWMGAHPSAPSRIGAAADAPTLLDFVAADPVGMLGAEVAGRFKNRLPFLLKVLAAKSALSIQTHPTRAQAEAGFAAEREREGDAAGGSAAEGPNRNYVDDWPKPEILFALTRFEALAGCRVPEDAAEVLRVVGIPALDRVRQALADDPAPATVAATIGRLLDWPEAERARLIADVVAACRRVATQGGRYAAAADAVVRVSADHPGDLGLVAMLLLNHVVLEPGQAMFLAAGGLHAYIRGTGVELLANSDNVLRAGLTGKHVDVPELLRIMDPAVAAPILRGRGIGAGVETFDTPAPEFTLFHAKVGPESAVRVTIPGTGPRIVLALSGEVELSGSQGTLTLARGASCFVPARDGVVAATGLGEVVVAAPGI
jgi:mannose-6-phosphate isomerase